MKTCPDLCSSVCAGKSWQPGLILVLLCMQGCHDNLPLSFFCVCAGMACQPIIFLFFVCRHVMTSWPGLSSSVRTTWHDFLFSLSAGLSQEPDVKFVLLCAVCRDAMATCVLHFSSLYVQGCHDKLPQSLFFCVQRHDNFPQLFFYVCSVMTTFHKRCSSVCSVMTTFS